MPSNTLLQTTFATLSLVNPELTILFIVVQGYFGLLFETKQDEVHEFVEFIKNNPESFAKEMTETKAFKDGFILVLEAYLKERTFEKRLLIQNVFLGFINSEVKEEFELERIASVISRISFEGVKYIKFLTEEIIPQMDASISVKAEEFSQRGAHDMRYWINHLNRTESLDYYIRVWIDDNFDPGSPKVIQQYGYDPKEDVNNEKLSMIYEKKQPILYQLEEMMSEFESLGILRSTIQGGGGIGGGGGTQHYVFTDFGRMFLDIII